MKRAAAAAALAVLAILAACAPARPRGAPETARDVPVETRGETTRLGSSWIARVKAEGSPDGLLLARVEGAPYDLGYAFGRLGRPLAHAQEEHLEALFEALIPSSAKRALIRQLSAFRLRGLPDEIPADLVLSIAGLADGYEPVPPASGWNAWRRMLDLHALHDVSQRYVDAPGLAGACTGFLAKTRDGGLLLARNFDFEGGDVFDRQKLVFVAAPEGKIPYLSVVFPGMLGAVSGFNREGIGVALQAVVGGETAASGTPMTLLLADVLRSESTFDGAVSRLRSARVFVSDLVLLADAKSGRIAVVEKGPSAFAVRETSGPRLGATNEAEDPAVRATGKPLPPGSTSRKRRARLDLLLAARGDAMDVPGAIAILRDRRGADGRELGPGNRNAIDASIAAHSVVLDLARRRAWVAAAPHTLGPYVPIDLDAVLAAKDGPPPLAAAPVPADPWLVSGGYARYLEARAALAEARRLEEARADGWLPKALAAAERAHALAPDFAEGTAKLGELVFRGGDRARARELLDEALAHDPGPAPAARRYRKTASPRSRRPTSSSRSGRRNRRQEKRISFA